jgi:phenylacetate-CoA ligase
MHPQVLSRILALEQGLKVHERLPPEKQAELQSVLLGQLLRHAHAHSPFWRARLEAAGLRPGERVAPEDLARLPVLTRAELQDDFEGVRARAPGQGPELFRAVATSGSTGRPVRIEQEASAQMQWQFATARRLDAWHGRDPTRILAVITDTEDGERQGWRPDLAAEDCVGKVVSRNMIAHPPGALLDWLAGQHAAYLLTVPSMARALAEAALADAGRKVPLEQIVTFGERLDQRTRALAREAFGARMIGIYGCEEASWIALECPAAEGALHLLSSAHILEIVRQDGGPCAPGEPGRVLLTPLRSHAMPLVRYELGDIAEWAAEPESGTCACGMALPLIAEVHGRERSFLRLADGSLRLARLTGEHWTQVAPVREFRLVQYADGLVEAFLRCARPLSGDERRGLEAMLHEVLDPSLAILLSEVERIDWPPGWKRHEVMRIDRLR